MRVSQAFLNFQLGDFLAGRIISARFFLGLSLGAMLCLSSGSLAEERDQAVTQSNCVFELISHPLFRNRRVESWTKLAQSGEWRALELEVISITEILEQVESGDYAQVYGLPLLTKALKKKWVGDPALVSRMYHQIAHHLPQTTVSDAGEIWFQELIHRAFGLKESRALTQRERLEESNALLGAALAYWKSREAASIHYTREKRGHFRKQTSQLKLKVESEWRSATPQIAWAFQQSVQDGEIAILSRIFYELGLKVGQDILGKDQKQMSQWLSSFLASPREI